MTQKHRNNANCGTTPSPAIRGVCELCRQHCWRGRPTIPRRTFQRQSRPRGRVVWLTYSAISATTIRAGREINAMLAAQSKRQLAHAKTDLVFGRLVAVKAFKTVTKPLQNRCKIYMWRHPQPQRFDERNTTIVCFSFRFSCTSIHHLTGRSMCRTTKNNMTCFFHASCSSPFLSMFSANTISPTQHYTPTHMSAICST